MPKEVDTRSYFEIDSDEKTMWIVGLQNEDDEVDALGVLAPKIKSRWVHVKTRKEIVVYNVARLEATLQWVVVYACGVEEGDAAGRGKVWVRPLEEFMDGRFE